MRISENTEKQFFRIAGAFELAGFALAVRRWVFNTAVLDPIRWRVLPVEESAGILWFAVSALAAVAVFAIYGKPERLGRKLAPALLLPFSALLKPDVPALLLTLAACSWCALRVMGGKWRSRPAASAKYAGWGVAFLALAAAAWSFIVQKQAFDTLFLAYQDWGEYTESYLRLAFGGENFKAFLARAGHCNPLPNLLMTALLYLVTAPETVFATTALLLASLPVLGWKLARECRLPAGCALGFAVIATFNPVFVNQSLSLFYGFHPVLFQGPLILWFLIMENRGCRWGMAAAIAASLCVQETAAVLWFGYGICLLTRKKYLPGGILCCVCPLFFILAGQVIMPFALGSSGNPQVFHYAQLGNTPLEIALSPLLRPGAFFGTLCQKENVFFIAALLLPLGGIISRRALIIGAPLFLGVLLQGSPQIKNPAMQYGFELSVLLTGCAATDFYGISRGLRRGALRGAVAMTLLCAFFYAQLPYGKYSARPRFRSPSAKATIEYLRGFSVGDTRVLSTRRLRLYHMFDRRTAPLDGEWEVGDTIVLDLDDKMEDVEAARRRLLADRRAMPVTSTNFYGSQFTVWKIAPPGVRRGKMPFMIRTSPGSFAALGSALGASDGNFSLRLRRAGERGAQLLVRLDRRTAYDVNVGIGFVRDGRAVTRRVPFGDGILPAWSAVPGDTYVVDLKDADPGSVSVVLIPRGRRKPHYETATDRGGTN